jgi:hypothetical protein
LFNTVHNRTLSGYYFHLRMPLSWDVMLHIVRPTTYFVVSLNLENKHNMFLSNIRKHSTYKASSHPKRMEFAITLL